MLNRMGFDNAVEILNGTTPLMAVAATYYQVVAEDEEQNIDPFAMDRISAYELTMLELKPVADRFSEPIDGGLNSLIDVAVGALIAEDLLMAADEIWTIGAPETSKLFRDNPDFGARTPMEFLTAVRIASKPPPKPDNSVLNRINDLIGKMARPLR